MSANTFIADELANRMIYFSKELDKAQNLILKLEQENTNLKEIIDQIGFVDNPLQDDKFYADIT